MNKSEQLENAENQKISSEKMNSSLHRLHVDFDDLSVVDEEEELKKEKERTASEDSQPSKEEKNPLSILKPRHLHENIPFYPGTYEPPALSSSSYYTGCPFKFPSTVNLMMPSDTVPSTPCPRLHTDPLLPIPNLTGTSMDQVNEQILHVPPVGWQTNITLPQKQIMSFGTTEVGFPLDTQPLGGIHREQVDHQRFAPSTNGFSNFPNLLQRRISLKQSTGLMNGTPFGNSQSDSENVVIQNGLGLDVDPSNLQGTKCQGSEDSKKRDAEEKSKHFFAPLPSKLKKQSEDPLSIISQFGTATSSSSGRTESTVISKSPFMVQKGSADVYVNGAVPYEDSAAITEQRTFRSTENLLINDDKTSSSNQLTKSMSCQDLSSESQNASVGQVEGKKQMLTQSDNTLDNISDSKPFKSHLSVTLKRPHPKQTVSPSTPKIPKLPSIDYRLFNNPFLRTFDPTCNYANQNNVTSPLSVQVNDDNCCYYPSQPEVSTFQRGVHLNDRYRPVQPDQSRLLIPSNQLINGKLMPSANKHEIQVTSFEKPSPHTLIGSTTPYEFNTLRRLNANPYLQNQNMYQSMPFMPRGGMYSQRGMLYYDNLALKVPVQTQTSIDGDSHHEDDHTMSREEITPSTPSGQRRRRIIRKEKSNLSKDHKSLSPAAQRRLKKQVSVASSEVPESPEKVTRKGHRKLSITTTTTSEGQEDKPESRSSSSGQDSPKKDQIRRVSLYFNAKKRPSLTSIKTTRSGSFDTSKEKDGRVSTDRERTNSISSREITGTKTRKTSTSSGNVPWCACWGNGCI